MICVTDLCHCLLETWMYYNTIHLRILNKEQWRIESRNDVGRGNAAIVLRSMLYVCHMHMVHGTCMRSTAYSGVWTKLYSVLETPLRQKAKYNNNLVRVSYRSPE